jgi:hypothetical protein
MIVRAVNWLDENQGYVPLLWLGLIVALWVPMLLLIGCVAGAMIYAMAWFLGKASL